MTETDPSPAPPPAPDDLQVAAAAFFPDATRVEPVPLSDDLVRVEAASGIWCVRRWPATATRARITLVHNVLTRAAAVGLAVLPNVAERSDTPGEHVLLHNGRLYDAQSWLSGRPLTRQRPIRSPAGEQVNLPARLPEPALTELVETVARVHEATRPLATAPNAPGTPLLRVLSTIRQTWVAHRARLGPVSDRSSEVRTWLRLGHRVLDPAAAALEAAPDAGRTVSVITHSDLWPTHALYTRQGGEPRLIGLIDWTRAAAGSPLIDLAHLATHFGGWTRETAELVLGAYGAVAPLSPAERRLLPAVAALDLLVETGWLLELGFAEPAMERDPGLPAVRTGTKTLMTSLDTLATLVERGDTPTKPLARRWTPAPPNRRQRPPPRNR